MGARLRWDVSFEHKRHIRGRWDESSYRSRVCRDPRAIPGGFPRGQRHRDFGSRLRGSRSGCSNPADSWDSPTECSDAYGGYVSDTVKASLAWLAGGDPQRWRRTPPAGTNGGAPDHCGHPTTTPYDGTDDALTHKMTGRGGDKRGLRDQRLRDRADHASKQRRNAWTTRPRTPTRASVTWTVQGQTATANLTINIIDLEAVLKPPCRR